MTGAVGRAGARRLPGHPSSSRGGGAPRAAGLSALLLLLAALPASGQTSSSAQVRIERPRDFGYRVGDLLELRASVRVPPGFALDERVLRDRSLPDWLETRETSWQLREEEAWASYRFRFLYQIFHAPQEVTRLDIPDVALLFRSGRDAEELRVSIPGFGFTVSPVTDSISALEPDWPVRPPSSRGIRLSGTSLAALLLLWGASAVGARRRRPRGVFSRAHREVRRAPDSAGAMLVLHRALEERAGKALFSHDFEALVERWPPAGAVRDDLERFFALSESLFFGDGTPREEGDGTPAAPSPESRRRAVELSARLAELELRRGGERPAAWRRSWSSPDPGR
ncbi:MAG: hypothetical protein ACE5JR_03945 [Gemmatimonadota bacterium]